MYERGQVTEFSAKLTNEVSMLPSPLPRVLLKLEPLANARACIG